MLTLPAAAQVTHPRTFRADSDGRVFMFGTTTPQRGHSVAFSVELMGRNTTDPADRRDLAQELLRYVVGYRAAGRHAPAFRDEVLAALSTTWTLSDREIVAWLQAR